MTDFAITTNDARIQYTATGGQTAFPYDFPIFDDDHLTVTRVRSGTTTTLVKTTDYTVSGVGQQAGGTVTLTSGATASDLITIERSVPAERATDYSEAGDFFATALNQDLDLLVMQDQQIIRDLDRTLRLSAEDTLTTLNALPSASARANAFLTFTASGQPSVAQGASDVPVSSAIAPILQAVSVSAGRDAFGLEIGSDVQAYDAALSSIASVSVTADQLLYAIAADQFAATTITQFGRTLLDDATAAIARSTLAAFVVTEVQTFTSSGTYTRGANTRNALLFGVGPGGGGGGVSNAAASKAASGGGQGEIGFAYIPEISAAAVVTIAPGGAPGDTSGSDGAPGGSASFGVYMSLVSGSGGKGATASGDKAGGIGGTGGSLHPTAIGLTWRGAAGGNASVSTTGIDYNIGHGGGIGGGAATAAGLDGAAGVRGGGGSGTGRGSGNAATGGSGGAGWFILMGLG